MRNNKAAKAGAETEARIRAAILANYGTYEDRFGVGPCGAVAWLLEGMGFGQLTSCLCYATDTPRTEFNGIPHYLNTRSDGSLFDASLPFAADYEEVELETELPSGPARLWGKDDHDFWRPILEAAANQTTTRRTTR